MRRKKPEPPLPGPGKYSLSTIFGTEGQKFTLKGRFKNLGIPRLYKSQHLIDSSPTRGKSPGPCEYSNSFSFSAKGHYFCSKYKNSMAPAFSPAKSKRFQSIRSETNK